MTLYLLDANVFIEAKRRHYGFDFCPAFWDWLVEQNRDGKVASVVKVAEELYKGEDELKDWAKERGSGFFLKPDATVMSALPIVSNWASSQNYRPSAVSTFLQGADYWLVIHALAFRCIVVTLEVRANTKRDIKIPNACDGFSLCCINPYDMLRREGARFVLGSGGGIAQ